MRGGHHLSPDALVVYLKTDNRSQIARELGIHRRQVTRWLSEGRRIRLSTADRIATRLGVHPSDIFPDYYD